MNERFSILALIASCTMTSCLGTTTVKLEQLSPAGKYKAVLSESDTGAVGGWMSAVRVLDLHATMLERVLGHDADTVFGADVRSSNISFSWRNEHALLITCGNCNANSLRVKKSAWKNLEIVYDVR